MATGPKSGLYQNAQSASYLSLTLYAQKAYRPRYVIIYLILIFLDFAVSLGIVGVLARPQEEGYNYEVPENPLVISRPTEAPEPPPVEPVEAESESRPEAQDGGHGGGGHGHHDSDDPLDWLRASVPGKKALTVLGTQRSTFLHFLKDCEYI